MRRKSNWFFELEFQLDQNSKYQAEVVIGSNVTRDVWGVVPLGEFGSIREMKKEFTQFRQDFLRIYREGAKVYMKKRGIGGYGE